MVKGGRATTGLDKASLMFSWVSDLRSGGVSDYRGAAADPGRACVSRLRQRLFVQISAR